jgi:hypothetical protein
VTLTRLPEAAAWCVGVKEGWPGVFVDPCNTCARCNLPVTGGPGQRYFTTYPRTDDGQCVRWMSMHLPQMEIFE